MVVAGPTASGKSALAVALAQALDGEVVNADSMQVYRDLSILTARPDADEMAGVPHHLYGLLAADETCAAGLWLEWMHALLPEIWARGRVAVVTGGTGLYIRALIDGLAPVPEVAAGVRAAVSADYDRDPAAFVAALAAVDPASAAAIPPANRQRMIRAAEVFRATGRPISAWQAEPHRGGLAVPPAVVAIEPERAWLYDRCDRRFDRMLQTGAWEQVRAAMAAGLTPEAPLARGLGARALMAALAGDLPEAEAVARAQRETRNYAKRQSTWFRRQLDADLVLRPPADALDSPRIAEKVAEILKLRRHGGCKGSAPRPADG